MAVGRTYRTSGADVVGLDDFRRTLKAMGPQWAKALLDAHKQVSERGAEWSRWELAGTGTRQQQLAIDAIRGKATQKWARIGVTASRRVPWALAAVWGAYKKTGWYADPVKYKQSTASQFQPWVGNSWDVAVAGGGPYGINPALAQHLPDILDFYKKMLDDISAKAFPE